MKPKVIITGGAGYIGSHVSKLFLQNNHPVIVLDNFSSGHREVMDILKNFGQLDVIEADLRDKDEIKSAFAQISDCRAVLHFAAKCSVGESVEYPHKYFNNNVCGSMNLLEAMMENNIKKMIFSSTCAVYGESQYLPIDEEHPTKPTNPYGESKLMVEKALKWYSKAYDLNYTALRYFNVCGASREGDIGDSKDPSVHLVQNAVRGALGIEPFRLTYPPVKTDDGSPIRDYVDVNDLAEAHYLAFQSLLNKGTKENVFNIGTGRGNSVLEIVETVEERLGTKLPREGGDERPGEYAAVYASYKKAKEILGWEPKTKIGQSIDALKKWYESHPTGFN